MGVSGVGGPGLSGSGVIAVDEDDDYLGPLANKALSVLNPEALQSLGAVRFDILKVEAGSSPECSVKSTEEDFRMS